MLQISEGWYCFSKRILFKSMLVTRRPMKHADDSILQKALPLKLIEAMNASIFASSFLNFVHLGDLLFVFTIQTYVQGAKRKKLLID